MIFVFLYSLYHRAWIMSIFGNRSLIPIKKSAAAEAAAKEMKER